MRTTLFAILGFCIAVPSIAQNPLGKNLNTLETAVPFLLICPDSRAGALGESGAATSPDANSIHWNPAKLAFSERTFGLAFSYSPWLRKLVPDINHIYFSGYYNLKKRHTVGLSIRGLMYGYAYFRNQTANIQEWAGDFTYSYRVADRWSLGGTVRYIYSNSSGGISIAGAAYKAAKVPAFDVSLYHQTNDESGDSSRFAYAFGVNLSDMGPRMYYADMLYKKFLPINLRIGNRITVKVKKESSISFSIDINKQLVPSPPVYAKDTVTGQPLKTANGNYVILSGMTPDRSVPNGMFSSFYDAPGEVVLNSNGQYEVVKGSRFREELREIRLAGGAEFWYKQEIAVRLGYFHEHSSKGNRKFITMGTGMKYKIFGLDFAYLIPVNFDVSVTQRSPLENTLRFTLLFELE